MAFTATADSSRTGIRVVAEATPGTTPATPAMKELEITGESFTNSRQTLTSQSFRSDRQVPGATKVSETNGGDLNIELKYGGVIDDLFEACLQGTWTADVVSNGVTRRSFTLEKEFGLDSGERFEVYRGAEVTGMSLSMAVGQMITGSFSFLARSFTSGTATVAGSVVPAPTTEFMNAVNDSISLKIDGSDVGAIIQAFDFSLDNNAREQRAIGSADLAGVGMGRSNLTGNMTVFFSGANNPIYTAYKTETPISLSIDVPDVDGNIYTFTFPKVILMSSQKVAGSLDTDVVMEMSWQAVLGGANGKTIEITRTPAVAP